MKKVNPADLWSLFKNSIVAILMGQFLLRLNIGRYFIHIVYTFFLFALTIWLSLRIETSMAKVERNKQTLKELEIIHSQKTFDVVSLSKRSEVTDMLKAAGSEVTEAGKPAVILK
ncbi:MAG: hypothetical protein MJY89_03010 [Bacteroidales bacterium]|nr:hypothetical protein [Bacteroidales bacterium]